MYVILNDHAMPMAEAVEEIIDDAVYYNDADKATRVLGMVLRLVETLHKQRVINFEQVQKITGAYEMEYLNDDT